MADKHSYDTIIIGAGAAGMMCAAQCGGRTLVIDHAKAPGEKIRISGGGRCNFTNIYASPDQFLSQNPHFVKSALSRYTQWDFIDLVVQHGIAYHEKTLGQLFCDDSAKQIIAMLLDEMEAVGADLWLQTSVIDIARCDDGFVVDVEFDGRRERLTCAQLVVACGGLSIPKMGATGLGYQIAEQFGHALTERRPALVPLTFSDGTKQAMASLSGLACDAHVACNGATFDEALLFTHRGLSGPSILQISSYWREGDALTVNLLPQADAFAILREMRADAGRRKLSTLLSELLPRRLAAQVAEEIGDGNLADFSDARLRVVADRVTQWSLMPAGSEGYRTAEVTLGGVDTDGINARSMESRHVPGLYFIGEVVDVTGWLGGYNFQWAWSSGWAAGQAIAAR